MAKLSEKIGYGLGDMSSSMFWKIFSYYLPIFYSNIFGLSLFDAGVLVLVTRLWDAVSDPMMGIISDRTKTRWGKYRPYLLWMAAPFSICGILLFTTPDWGYAGKLIWAYVTYILMMTVYTGINVPYGAMLGVVSDKPQDKTVFSSYRMFLAYAGSFISLFAWEPMCNWFENTIGLSPASSWQAAMVVIALACFILFLCCFKLTRENVRTVSTVSVGSDFKSLFKNSPWWILIAATMCFQLFGTVRGATVAYFFTSIIPSDAHILVFGASFLFFSGLFLGIGEIANMIGVSLTVPISNRIGKKSTFVMVNVGLVILSALFFFIFSVVPYDSQGGMWLMLILQVVISLLTGIMSPLLWSMYADVSDYSELRFKTASTGLIFSSSSMAQKFGGAFGGAAVMWLLDAYGYITPDAAQKMGLDPAMVVQPESAISCLWALIALIPAIIAVLAVLVISIYPLNTRRMDEIVSELKVQRASGYDSARGSEDADVAALENSQMSE